MAKVIKLGEHKGKRTPFSKHFFNSDGSFTAEIFSAPVHYEDEEGNLRTISTELVEEEEPVKKGSKKAAKAQGKFKGGKLPYKVDIDKDFSKGYSVGKGKSQLTFIPQGANSSQGEKINGSGLLFAEVWKETDVKLELLPYKVKETIILKDSTAPTAFSFEVDGPLEEDLTAGELLLEPAWLIDAAGTRRDVSQTIRKEGNKTYVDLLADTEGLTYPVEIDPTVGTKPVGAVGQDTDVRSGSPTTNFGSNTFLMLGNTGTGSESNRALINFDITSIPYTALVKSAILKVYVYASQDSTPHDFVAHPLTNSWIESTVTWNTQPGMDETIRDAFTLKEPSKFYEIPILGTARYMVSSGNKGLVLKKSGQEDYPWTVKYIASAEYSDATKVPSLTINYEENIAMPTVTSPATGEAFNGVHTIRWNPVYEPDVATVITREDFEDTTYQFNLNLDDDWARTTTEKKTGSYSISNTMRYDAVICYAYFSMTIPAGAQNPKISMDYKLSTEQGFDNLILNITNSGTLTILKDSGIKDWQTFEYDLSAYAGQTVNFQMLYEKDGSVAAGSDTVWVDNITLMYNTESGTTSANMEYEVQLSTDNGTTYTNILPTTAVTQVTGGTVVDTTYETSGTRKLALLDNGWSVAALKGATTINLYVNKHDGQGFKNLCYATFGTVGTDVKSCSITSYGTHVYMLVTYVKAAKPYVYCYTIDVPNQSNVDIFSLAYDFNDGKFNSAVNSSILMNSSGTEIYAAVTGQMAIYGNSNEQILVAKGYRNKDGSLTWGVFEAWTRQQSTTGEHFYDPEIVLTKNDVPIVISRFHIGEPRDIMVAVGRGFTHTTTYATAMQGFGVRTISSAPIHPTYNWQTAPSAVFLDPTTFPTLPNGRIVLVWAGPDTSNTNPRVRFCYSDDGGVTWSAENIMSSNTYTKPSLTYSVDGYLLLVCNPESSVGIKMFKAPITSSAPSFSLLVSKSYGYNGQTALPRKGIRPNALYNYPYYIFRDSTVQVRYDHGDFNVQQLRTEKGQTSYEYDFTNIPMSNQSKIRVRAYNGAIYSAWSTNTFSVVHKTVIGGYKIVTGTGYPMLLPIYDPAVGMDGKSQLRIEEDGAIGCFELVPVTDDLASPLRVQTSGGTKALGMDVAYIHNWDTQPFSTANTTVNSTTGGILNVTATNSDPQIMMYNIGSFDPNKYRYIDVRYRTVNGSGGNMEIFFTNSTYTSANGAAYVTANIIMDNTWRTVTLDMGSHAAWTTGGNITGWRFDWATIGGANLEIDWIRLRA